jgi:hypothetical protein
LYLQRKYDLPKRVDHRIMFVNTHGANSKDLVEALQGDAVTKRSFWLSKEYFVQAILPNLTF